MTIRGDYLTDVDIYTVSSPLKLGKMNPTEGKEYEQILKD